MISPPLPVVLCVDDEQSVLDGLARTLRGEFTVLRAESGADALAVLSERSDITVVVSDMRMPQMDGAELLARVRADHPDTVRVLLSGQSDLAAAASAVNEGGIFRFLTKPCERPHLIAALAAAVEQHRLIRSEQELLEQTLRGSVGALLEILALANPGAFARASRVGSFVGWAAGELGLADPWIAEMAASLSQVGAVTLPDSVNDRLGRGLPLTATERGLVDRLPAIAEGLLAPIPRLERVREAIARQAEPVASGEAGASDLPIEARLLRIALVLDAIEGLGFNRAEALGRVAASDPEVDLALVATLIESAQRCPESARTGTTIQTLTTLFPGMVVASDVHDRHGVLLIGRGMIVSERMLDRLRNIEGGLEQEIEIVAA